jgi:predicted TIM-barrel fold metal-dependent hydrolase
MNRIAKVDAHHHLWRTGSAHYPMLEAPGVQRFYGHTDKLKQDFGPEAFKALAARQNVVKSVYVESGYHPFEEEVEAVQAVADTHGFPHAIMGRAALQSEHVAAVLDRQMRSANFRGVRVAVNWSPDPLFSSAPQDGLLQDADWRRGFAAVVDRDLVADIMLLPRQMPDAAALAAEFTQARIVINHTGMPDDFTASGFQTWRDGMARMAQQPNIAMKISGLGMMIHDWTPDDIAPFVQRAVDLFGVARCMFASNFPVDGLHGTWDQVWDAFDQLTDDRPGADRAALFHDNAVRVYRL